MNSFEILYFLYPLLLHTLMSKSFREKFVCWLYEFYSVGKYIHVIAFQMVRIWINEQVVLWAEEEMKTSFPEFVSCVTFSILWLFPQPHLATFHLTHLLHCSSVLPACSFVDAGWDLAQLAGKAACSRAVSWHLHGPACFCPTPSQSQRVLHRPHI